MMFIFQTEITQRVSPAARMSGVADADGDRCKNAISRI